VIVGYTLELVLGVLLSVALANRHSLGLKSRLRITFSHAYATYADAAVLLSSSVQLASLVILVRKDFGISAADFGSLTMEVTWAAALLTMLPLTFLCYIYEDLVEEGDETEDRRDLRLILVCTSWSMFLYTFISRMIANYGPSQIGVPHPGAPQPVLTTNQARNIAFLCYDGREGLSASENIAFQVFALGGSLFVSVAVLGALGWGVAERFERAWLTRLRKASLIKWLHTASAQKFLIAFVTLWSIPQLWAVVRFRSMQQALAVSIGSADYDNSWSFGQIVAVTVFLPVLIELLFVYTKWTPYTSRGTYGNGAGAATLMKVRGS
jgi:hypothetical protein